ncbi:ATP-dependent nuclease [Bacillus thuringiensis]|uniref:ATP-dependent nuclease n=1 Tax=Bacillus thuringiensis TaxID=1428 RepID=UPI0020D28B41|nr:AAA family ATPase [Bacillus thuringiensis]HDR8127636.1 ATP-binding protein [Bacillus cereus]
MHKIKNINVKGFRSFSNDEAFVINDIRNFNLFIGKNNTGKSNITRLLKSIVHIIREARQISNETNYVLFQTIELSSDDFFLQNKVEIEYEDWISSPLGIMSFKTIVWSEWEKTNTIDNCYFKEMELNIKFENEETISIYSCNISNFKGQSGHYVVITGKKEDSLDLNSTALCTYLRILKDSFIFIDEARTVEVSIAKLLDKNSSSLNLADELVKAATESEKEWNSFINYIKFGFKEIVKEEFELYRNLEKDFNPADDLFVLYDELPVKLRDLGSGISQILMFLTFFYRYRNKENVYVFIDEPESNIHPETLIRLFRFCTSELSHQYFLLTHSSVLIDQTDFVDQIYMINREDKKTMATEIYNNKQRSRYLFDLIGVKPSQLLQSNCVIWIEGPSDRIYIKHWLNIYTKALGVKEYTEGRDYSFVMYGGSLISHYDVDPVDLNKYIDLFSTSSNVYLVADSDLSKDRGEYKENLKRILAHARDNFGVWVTAGKEIENYVPHKVFLDIFSKEKGFMRSKDKPNINKLKGKMFGKNDIYSNFYSGLYDNRKKKRIIKSSFFRNKVKLAEKVTEKWNRLDSLDLNYRIKDLYEFIKKTNI